MRILLAKTLLIMILAGSRFIGHAQQHEVAMAEQAFAKMSADSGARKAFLHFLDSNSLLFHEGKSFDGLRLWRGMTGGRSQVLWKPVYTGMAGSGDLGFSTGPFEQRDASAGNVQGGGNYTSIWVKNKQGEWKVIIDMGASYNQSLYQQQWKQLIYNKLSPVGEKINWQQIEQDIINQLHQKGYQAFLPYLTTDSWFNMLGHHPLYTIKDIESGLQKIPAGLQFELLGGAISAAGDLFYAYGAVTLNGKKENYLRVWGHEKDGWKLLLQVLKWAN
jgi:ketosteroid isomerase-like protein